LTGKLTSLKFFFALVLGCVLTHPACGALKETLPFDGQSLAETDDKTISVIDDPSGQYDFEQIRRQFASQQTAPGGTTACAATCWLKVTLQNTATSEVIAQLQADGDFAYADTWVERADHSVQRLAQGGDDAKTDQHDLVAHASFRLAGGERATFYVRVSRPRFFEFGTGQRLAFTPLIFDLEEEIPLSIGRGLLIGALLGLAIYNLLIALSTRDRSYRWYCAYLLMMAISFTSASGRAPMSLLISSEHTLLARVVGHGADASMWLCLIMFTRSFLNTPERLGKWDRLFLIPAAILVFGFLLGFTTSQWWIPVSYVGFESAAPLGLLASVVALRQDFRPAKFVLAGQLVLAVGAFLQTAIDHGWIDFDVDVRQPFLWILAYKTLWVCSTVEALIFSLALANRMKSLQQEVNLRIISNLRDRETLINQQRVDLELEVAARTRDLVEEKNRSDRLLENILPDEIASELKANGSTKPKRYDNASVLFTDFRGFTTVVSSLPADRLVHELNQIFRSFDDILDEVGVEKIKTIGDSYMIVAGVPAECEDHALRCAEAALRMLEFIQQRNQSASIKWEMRAGIHSGAVVAGIVGKRKFAYDIFGDTVNIASRMESAGSPGRLNVSAYTYDLIRHQYAGEYRGKVNAKGKGDVDMYFIDRAASTQVDLAAG
jgi:class 3 adenylate cyclase